MEETLATPSLPAAPARRGRLRRSARATALVAAVLAAYTIVDLYRPVSSRMRSFDADEVGRLETAMWRSYYSRQRFALFAQLAELMRTQYNMPIIRSNAVAYQAAKAAFVFKDGKSRSDYERALPNLVAFYTDVRAASDIPFDVNEAARLELEWWIVHRERASHAPGDLHRALAELAAEVYRVPVERMMEHARLRAEAMEIRDTKAAAGGVTEEDWARIDELLHASWRSLKREVNAPA